MQPVIIYLARHGETDWNRQNRWQGRTDIALNDLGRAQAAELAERVRALGIARVHASDLARARETGEIVAARLPAPFGGLDERLRERAFGLFEGLTADECAERHPDHWRRYLEDRRQLPPGAESEEAVARRIREALLALAALAGGPALIVSHGSIIRTLWTQITGKPRPPVGNGGLVRVRIDGAEIVEVSDLTRDD